MPFLLTYSSPAVRLAQAAIAAGVSLAGARIAVDGEPVTAARVRAVREAGAEPVPDVRDDGDGARRPRGVSRPRRPTTSTSSTISTR